MRTNSLRKAAEIYWVFESHFKSQRTDAISSKHKALTANNGQSTAV
jgi:hypothetical protein